MIFSLPLLQNSKRMNQQACPVNYKKVNVYLLKFYSSIIALFLLGYFFFGWTVPIYIITIDFAIRVFLGIEYSFECKILNLILEILHIQPKEIDASTKMFAAKVGLLFSVSLSLALLFQKETLATIIAVVFFMAVFAEVVLNFCAACYMESLWKKYFGRKTEQERFFE